MYTYDIVYGAEMTINSIFWDYFKLICSMRFKFCVYKNNARHASYIGTCSVMSESPVCLCSVQIVKQTRWRHQLLWFADHNVIPSITVISKFLSRQSRVVLETGGRNRKGVDKRLHKLQRRTNTSIYWTRYVFCIAWNYTQMWLFWPIELLNSTHCKTVDVHVTQSHTYKSVVCKHGRKFHAWL